MVLSDARHSVDIGLLDVVQRAVREDVGRGDVTTSALVDPGARGSALIVYRAAGIVCGVPIAAAVFRATDPCCEVQGLETEGAQVPANTAVAEVRGPAASILIGERVALNFLARVAGVATLTRRFVDAIAGTRAQILDTRKTTPGLRAIEKYAVRTGGGRNHRLGLDDGVLIKDNHLRIAGSVTAAVARARRCAPATMRIEVEVETIDQLQEALGAGADMILLDNMAVPLMSEAVRVTAGCAVLEASGGITLANVRAVAETGVDFISVGALTHSAGSIDVAMDMA